MSDRPDHNAVMARIKSAWPVIIFAALTLYLTATVVRHIQSGAEDFFRPDSAWGDRLAFLPVRSLGLISTYCLIACLMSLVAVWWLRRDVDAVPRRTVGLPLLLLGISGFLGVLDGGNPVWGGQFGESLAFAYQSALNRPLAVLFAGGLLAFATVLARDWFFFEELRSWFSGTAASPAFAVGMPTGTAKSPSREAQAADGAASRPWSVPDDVRPIARRAEPDTAEVAIPDIEAAGPPQEQAGGETAVELDVAPDADAKAEEPEIVEAEPIAETSEPLLVEATPELEDEIEAPSVVPGATGARSGSVMIDAQELDRVLGVDDDDPWTFDSSFLEPDPIELDFSAPAEDDVEDVPAVAEAASSAHEKVETEDEPQGLVTFDGDEAEDDESDPELIFGHGAEAGSEDEVELEDEDEIEDEQEDEVDLEDDDEAEYEYDEDEEEEDEDEDEEYELEDEDEWEDEGLEDDDEVDLELEDLDDEEDEQDEDGGRETADDDGLISFRPLEVVHRESALGPPDELDPVALAETDDETDGAAESGIHDFGATLEAMADENDDEDEPEVAEGREPVQGLLFGDAEPAPDEEAEAPAGGARTASLLQYAESARGMTDQTPPPTPSAGPGPEDWAPWELEDEARSPSPFARESSPRRPRVEPVAGADLDAEAYERAVRTCLEQDSCSVSLLQRSLGMDFATAAGCIERMEREKIVGPYQGSGKREILVSPDEWDDEV